MSLTPKRLLAVCIITANVLFSIAAETDFQPKIEGTIRAKYEYNTSLDAQRFQVRNARFSVSGKFSNLVSYKAEIDLSDEGQTKMLDAFVRYQPQSWWSFTVGQQKVPFSTDNIRSPHQFYFANRSFIGKQLTGLRDVGATLFFQNKKILPFDVYAGVYNGTGLYNQKEWRNDLSYAFRTVIYPTKFINIELNASSIKPYDLRMNVFDLGAHIDLNNWHLETEFFFKNYENKVFDQTQGMFAAAAYDIATPKLKHIKIIRPCIRYDSMTDNNKGLANTNGIYVVDDLARARLTAGITLCLGKPFTNEIRLNYENYTNKNGFQTTENKFVAEFVVRF